MGTKAGPLWEGLLAAHPLHWDEKAPFRARTGSSSFPLQQSVEGEETVVTEAVDSASASHSEKTNLSVYNVSECASHFTLVPWVSQKTACPICQ